MTDRDAFRGAETGARAKPAGKNARFERFLERTVKRHPDLKGLKAADPSQRP